MAIEIAPVVCAHALRNTIAGTTAEQTVVQLVQYIVGEMTGSTRRSGYKVMYRV